MYADGNPKTKKELKARVAAWADEQEAQAIIAQCGPLSVAAIMLQGRKRAGPVRVFSPGPFPAPTNGSCVIEGPHYPQPHRWYAQVWVENGIITKVIS